MWTWELKTQNYYPPFKLSGNIVFTDLVERKGNQDLMENTIREILKQLKTKLSTNIVYNKKKLNTTKSHTKIEPSESKTRQFVSQKSCNVKERKPVHSITLQLAKYTYIVKRILTKQIQL